jgi:hypothetical protein
MIISALHKFIFVAIPKTGTHSVRQALREHMGPRDIEQVGLFVQKRFPIPELAQLQHGHLSLQQVRPYLRPEEWASFFKFAFVRNLFDRFVSYCAFMTRADGQFDRDPRQVMRHFLFEAPPHGHLLFRPQHLLITDEGGQLLTDYVGRVERMQESYEEIAGRIGIPTRPLDKVNASERRDYREYYDQQLIDGVAKHYARDLKLFDYRFLAAANGTESTQDDIDPAAGKRRYCRAARSGARSAGVGLGGRKCCQAQPLWRPRRDPAHHLPLRVQLRRLARRL